MQPIGTHIIALETSLNASGSVAALSNHRLLESRTLSKDQRSAVSLAPTIDEILKKLQWQRNADHATLVQLIAVVRGPGSFTGLRIGVTTAKMLSYAWQIPVMGILATDCLALQVSLQLGAAAEKVQLQLDQETNRNKVEPVESIDPSQKQGFSNICSSTSQRKISVAIDAHRQQVFTADYFFDPVSTTLRLSKQTHLADIDQWIASLEESTYVCGPVLEKLLPRLSGHSSNLNVAPEAIWNPLAETAGIIAWHRFRSGQQDDPFQLEPLYLRPSYAEEKRAN